MRNAIRRIFICSVLTALISACGTGGKAHDSDNQRHLVEVGERLKEKLGEKYDLPIIASGEVDLLHGKELYDRLCAACHGSNGKGDGPTAQGLAFKIADFTDHEQASFFSDQGRIYIIRNGIDGTPMLGWGNMLTDRDILAVYVYVQSFAKPKTAPSRE